MVSWLPGVRLGQATSSQAIWHFWNGKRSESKLYQVDDARAVKRNIPITEEIYRVGGPGLTAAEDAAIYTILLSGHAALIDAGC
jgi:hypothetical protein